MRAMAKRMGAKKKLENCQNLLATAYASFLSPENQSIHIKEAERLTA